MFSAGRWILSSDMMQRLFRHAIIACSLLLLTELAVAQTVVVVNPKSGVAVLTRNEVMNIFFGRYRQFFTGLEALPVDLVDGNPERERFYHLLVGKSVAEVNAYWSRLVFSGRVSQPPQVAGAEEVIRWVSANMGGIGFIDISKVDARVRVVFELN